MKRIFWVLLRVAAITTFGVGIPRMASGAPPMRLGVGDFVFLLVIFVVGAWRFVAGLRKRHKEMRPKDDWSAPLWTSPILKNPESFLFIGGLAFVSGGLLGVAEVWNRPGSVLVAAMPLALGAGSLAGVAIFRFGFKKLANHTTEPASSRRGGSS